LKSTRSVTPSTNERLKIRWTREKGKTLEKGISVLLQRYKKKEGKGGVWRRTLKGWEKKGVGSSKHEETGCALILMSRNWGGREQKSLRKKTGFQERESSREEKVQKYTNSGS